MEDIISKNIPVESIKDKIIEYFDNEDYESAYILIKLIRDYFYCEFI